MNHIQVKFETTATAHGRKRVTSPRPRKAPAPPRVPHIIKLMALAIRLEHLLATGQVKDQAEIARTAGITRARVTQILNLLNLAPEIQQALLDLEPSQTVEPPLPESELRQIAIETSWIRQRRLWKQLALKPKYPKPK